MERVAVLHRKVRRQRLDHAHKTARDLVRGHDVIAHEDLRIRNMSAAPAPRRSDPLRRAAWARAAAPCRSSLLGRSMGRLRAQMVVSSAGSAVSSGRAASGVRPAARAFSSQ
ncbi:hypothetical protein [Streptomyces sp. NPDC001137]|uniref:hypothetical protein n=1 Tax=Streptomyces sp. NPDC001137 TaxID=3154378 RepID=UPI00331F97F8